MKQTTSDSEPPASAAGDIYIVTHTYGYGGASMYLVRSETKPTEEQVILALDGELDYEPEKGEELFVGKFDPAKAFPIKPEVIALSYVPESPFGLRKTGLGWETYGRLLPSMGPHSDALESLVLALAQAGVDFRDPKIVEALHTACDAVLNYCDAYE